MPGNPYRIVMLLFAIFGAVAGVLFLVIGLQSRDAFQTGVAFAIAQGAGGFAAFWFTVWLIVSAARWRPPTSHD